MKSKENVLAFPKACLILVEWDVKYIRIMYYVLCILHKDYVFYQQNLDRK